MTPPDPPDFEPADLLRHDRWLRRLARSLVHEAEAEDLAQDAWVTAVERRPDTGRSLRGWLATVVRRLAGRQRRAAARRLLRERRAASHEELPSTDETVALLEAQRHVSAAVSSMPEPYRTAILLRYFHGLSSAEIARREGITEEAARKRIERGLEHLRRKLRDAYGEGWRGSPAVVALAGPRLLPLRLTTLLSGAFVMSKILKAATAALLVVLLGVVAWSIAPPSSSGPPPVVEPAGSAIAAETGAIEPVEPPGTATPPSRTLSDSPAVPSPPARNVCVGQVIDPRGSPLGGVPLVAAAALHGMTVHGADELRLRDRLPEDVRSLIHEFRKQGELDLAALPVLGISAADGGFAIAADQDAPYLLAGPGWATLRSPRLTGLQSGNLLLVAAPAVSVVGLVVDDRGEALAEVRIHVSLPPLGDLPDALDGSVKLGIPPRHTEPDGTFVLDGLPSGIGGISFELDGYEPARLDVPVASLTGQRVVLDRVEDLHMVVTGRVLDHLEQPVAGALVGLHGRIVHADAEGRFRMVFHRPEDGPSPDSRLFAAHPGYQTLVIEEFGSRLLGDGHRDVVLHLPGPALSITGRVLDHSGHPVVGALVYPWNEAAVLADRIAEELGMTDDLPVQDLGPGIRVFANTGAGGAFELGGLRARDYRLRVLLQDSRAGFTTAPIAAGSSGVEVWLPEKLVFERIRGQVVTQDGEGVPGVTISPSVAVYLIEGKGRYGAGLRGTVSDAEGRFELRDLPCTDVLLWYSGAGIVPGQALLDTSDPLQGQRIVVARLYHLRLQVEPSRGARTFRVLDAAGKGLPILELTPGGQTSMNRWPIEDGRTGVLAVGETAATVVLEGDQGEIARLPLRLLPGEVTVVRY